VRTSVRQRGSALVSSDDDEETRTKRVNSRNSAASPSRASRTTAALTRHPLADATIVTSC
jgi:hypothetical protein